MCLLASAMFAGCGGGGATTTDATTTPAAAPTSATGTIELAWSAPATKADGSALIDIAGFIILIGTASGEYTRSITIQSPTASSFTVADLPPGATYYVAVKALDSANNESAASAEVSKTFQ